MKKSERQQYRNRKPFRVYVDADAVSIAYWKIASAKTHRNKAISLFTHASLIMVLLKKLVPPANERKKGQHSTPADDKQRDEPSWIKIGSWRVAHEAGPVADLISVPAAEQGRLDLWFPTQEKDRSLIQPVRVSRLFRTGRFRRGVVAEAAELISALLSSQFF